MKRITKNQESDLARSIAISYCRVASSSLKDGYKPASIVRTLEQEHYVSGSLEEEVNNGTMEDCKLTKVAVKRITEEAISHVQRMLRNNEELEELAAHFEANPEATFVKREGRRKATHYIIRNSKLTWHIEMVEHRGLAPSFYIKEISRLNGLKVTHFYIACKTLKEVEERYADKLQRWTKSIATISSPEPVKPRRKRNNIKPVSTPEKYDNIRKAMVEDGDNNFCVLLACAALTGADIEEIKTYFESCGRKKGSGTNVCFAKVFLKLKGLKVRKLDQKRFIEENYPKSHKILKGMTSHHPRRFEDVFAGKNLFCFNRTHAWAVVDGVNQDWSINRALRCHEVWEIESV